jgi:hypothetical protein
MKRPLFFGAPTGESVGSMCVAPTGKSVGSIFLQLVCNQRIYPLEQEL